MSIEELYSLFRENSGVSTDTRKIEQNSLFFALKGEHFDANTFAEQAIEQGAAYAIIDNEAYKKGDRYILVEDVLQSLQALAKHHRKHLNIPFIALTGTNGKTTTKELLNAVLNQQYKTHATKGNLNNHIGVPLTILATPPQTEIAIIEMGANHPGEIAFLCNIAQPTHGLITNVGKAHLEGFGGFEGVKKTKGELYQFLSNNNGIAFINRDNTHLMGMSQEKNLRHIVYYSQSGEGLVSGECIKANPFLEIKWTSNENVHADNTHTISSHLTGIYNLENILAAICVGKFFRLKSAEINTGISSYVPTNNRSQIIKTASNTLICDYYNANPSSMEVAVNNISSMEADKKVVILGDMFELGKETQAEHLKLIEGTLLADIDERIFIGEAFYQLHDETRGIFYRNTSEAYQALKASPIKDALILIKGSRSMKLETLAELL